MDVWMGQMRGGLISRYLVKMCCISFCCCWWCALKMRFGWWAHYCCRSVCWKNDVLWWCCCCWVKRFVPLLLSDGRCWWVQLQHSPMLLSVYVVSVLCFDVFQRSLYTWPAALRFVEWGERCWAFIIGRMTPIIPGGEIIFCQVFDWTHTKFDPSRSLFSHHQLQPTTLTNNTPIHHFKQHALPTHQKIFFRKFTQKENVSSTAQLKSSAQRDVRKGILDQFPDLEPFAEDVLPKKTPIYMAKCKDHVTIFLVDNVPLFFRYYEGAYMPTLRVLHKCMC